MTPHDIIRESITKLLGAPWRPDLIKQLELVPFGAQVEFRIADEDYAAFLKKMSLRVGGDECLWIAETLLVELSTVDVELGMGYNLYSFGITHTQIEALEVRLTDPAKIVEVPRELIEDRLLAAMDDRDCAAILANKDDIALIIGAFESSPVGSTVKGQVMLQDLRKLLASAFP